MSDQQLNVDIKVLMDEEPDKAALWEIVVRGKGRLSGRDCQKYK